MCSVRYEMRLSELLVFDLLFLPSSLVSSFGYDDFVHCVLAVILQVCAKWVRSEPQRAEFVIAMRCANKCFRGQLGRLLLEVLWIYWYSVVTVTWFYGGGRPSLDRHAVRLVGKVATLLLATSRGIGDPCFVETSCCAHYRYYCRNDVLTVKDLTWVQLNVFVVL